MAEALGVLSVELNRVRDQLVAAAGSNLKALVLYGGLARGRYRPGASDVDLLVLLGDTSPAALSALGPTLRDAYRSMRVEPLLLGEAELSAFAETFPTKLLDVQRHHVVLHGEPRLSEVQVSRERLRIRVAQELQNLGLRLRRRWVALGDDSPALREALSKMAVPLAVELSALMHVRGKEVPKTDSHRELLQAAAATLALDWPTLSALARLKRGEAIDDDPAHLYAKTMSLVTAAAALASQPT